MEKWELGTSIEGSSSLNCRRKKPFFLVPLYARKRNGRAARWRPSLCRLIGDGNLPRMPSRSMPKKRANIYAPSKLRPVA